MAPRKDPDIGWKYGYVIDGNKQKSRCKFCGHENMSGGVSRLKEHLAGGFKNVKKCPNCPKVIREEIQILLHRKVIEKAEKEKRHKTFTEALFQPSRLLDDDDEDEDSYPPDCTTDYERAQHRLAVQNSMADRWDAEQQWRMNIRGEDSGPTVREVGGSSGGHRTSVDEPRRRGGVFMRSASARVPNPSIDPDMLRKPESRQKRLKESWNGGNLKKGLNKMMSKLFYYSSIPTHVASNNPYFQSTIDEIAKCGPGFTGPTTYELMHGLLDDEYNELQDYIKTLKRSWSQYGVTIMCDGWTGPTRLSIINFMVYCDGKTIFHKSVDASVEKKDANFIYKLMSMVVKSVGKEHVIQIVTDNGSAFLKAGKKMMERYHLFWTPCAAHCIDLMLKDIGNHASVRKVVDQARKITNYIYNHHWVLALMREKCGGDIIRPGITRFATNYIALKSILDKKQGLKEMFASREWANYDHNGTSQAREVEGLVARPSFWEDARHIVNALDPIVRVLRMVDGDKRPTMGSLYEAIRLMKENIKGAAPRSNKWILKIIDRRWTTQLCHPLHQAAFFLSPMYQYKYDASITPELQLALNSVIARLVPDGEKQSAALNELKYFRDAMGSFGTAAATSGRKITHPGLAVAADKDFKTFKAAYPYIVRKLLTDNSVPSRRILHSAILNTRKELQWKMLALFLRVGSARKGFHAGAASNAEASLLYGPAGSSGVFDVANLVLRLLPSKDGVVLRRLLMTVDGASLIRAMVSKEAIFFRRQVSRALADVLHQWMVNAFETGHLHASLSSGFHNKEGTLSSGLSPIYDYQSVLRDRRLKVIFYKVMESARRKPLLMLRFYWASFVILVSASALACHRNLVSWSEAYISSVSFAPRQFAVTA